jgi:class 3 adenylate cyclase
MALKDDLEGDAASIFGAKWTERNGTVVPDPTDVNLKSNDAVLFEEATILYADLAGSTNMVDGYKPEFASEVYKAYLATAARIIRAFGGAITAYDGDRVMAVYLGNRKNTNAATTALKINYAVQSILMPAKAKKWSGDFEIKQIVGIDTSKVRAVRTGVPGRNDLVWVGRAANYAAKLASLNEVGAFRTYITKDVYDRLLPEVKLGGQEQQPMWESRTWTSMGNYPIYRSAWFWQP